MKIATPLAGKKLRGYGHIEENSTYECVRGSSILGKNS